ncbi:MAG: DUF2017 family protein [Ilumatobacteraceae bacterium]
MRWQFRPPVDRTKQGFRINLDADERALLQRLLAEFRDLLIGPDDNPALARIFPTAYHLPQHAEQDAEYQRLMREELVASRLAGLELIDQALTAKGTLTEGQVLAFSQGLNGLRLVLGTVLDVSDDPDDDDDIDSDDPLAAERQLYGFLSWLLEWTVRALSGA